MRLGRLVFLGGVIYLLIPVLFGILMGSFLEIDPYLSWNTFLGGVNDDSGSGITLDASGNLYVVGSSAASWGNPIQPYSGNGDAFVAKLDPTGNILWHTFIGGPGDDKGNAIAVDGSGNLFIGGTSGASFGGPIRSYSGLQDAFAAMLNSQGELQWLTFLGGGGNDLGVAVDVDGAGCFYLAGTSATSWESPVRPHSGGNEAFAAKLNPGGVLLWNSFVGGAGGDVGNGIADDCGERVFLVGTSSSSWGSPIRPASGDFDAFTACLDISGQLQWNTFLGSDGSDYGNTVTTDGLGNVFVAGTSWGAWGDPVTPYNNVNGTHYAAYFAAELNSSGWLQWNTFCERNDYWGESIFLDEPGNVFLTGIRHFMGRPYSQETYCYIHQLDSTGGFIWGDIFGAGVSAWSGYSSKSIVVDSSGNIYAVGTCGQSWGNPIRSFGGASDAFIVKYNPGSTSPEIGLSKASLTYGSEWNGIPTPAEKIIVDNTGAGTLNWTATPSVDWISVAPTNGTAPSELAVGISRTDMPPGSYSGTMVVSDPNAVNSPQTITVHLNVYLAGKDSPPFGFFDTPVSGSTVVSSIPVTGWALDDIGVQSIKIYLGTGLADRVFIGDAIFVRGARNDVEAAFPGYPQNDRAGWGYMLLTNFLPNGGNGQYELLAYAMDTTGHEILLGAKTIVCDNANAVLPFGAIDTPAQGVTASGNPFYNFGWALTPPPKSIPLDGSTITVWVDGLPLGHPVYNNYRADIATLFPGYLNSNGAVGVFQLDTTGYANGVHTIDWSVVDLDGYADGIGSRYFTIQNLDGVSGPSELSLRAAPESGGAVGRATLLSRSTAEIIALPEDTGASVWVRRGTAADAPAEIVMPDSDGSRRIAIPEVTRVAVYMNEQDAGESWTDMIDRGNRIRGKLEANEVRYEAYALAHDRIRPLPIGASFDPSDGVLYWQPGPGFLGEFSFLIVKRDGNRPLLRKIVTICIPF